MDDRLLKNYMEVCVEEELDQVIADLDVCNCEICRLDLRALALNSLQPKYVVTGRGELYNKLAALQRQYEVDIISALTKAAATVKKFPRH